MHGPLEPADQEWPPERTRLLRGVLGKLFNGDKPSCHASDLLLALRDVTGGAAECRAAAEGAG